MAMSVCNHLDQSMVTTLPRPIAGCEECLSGWVQARDSRISMGGLMVNSR